MTLSAKLSRLDLPYKVIDLKSLDTLPYESLGLFFASDSRPLTGLAGLLDWRFNGALSAVLQKGQFHGDLHEVALIFATARSRARRFFIFGLGPLADIQTPVLKGSCQQACAVMNQAKVKEIILALPTFRQHKHIELAFIETIGRYFTRDISGLWLTSHS